MLSWEEPRTGEIKTFKLHATDLDVRSMTTRRDGGQKRSTRYRDEESAPWRRTAQASIAGIAKEKRAPSSGYVRRMGASGLCRTEGRIQGGVSKTVRRTFAPQRGQYIGRNGVNHLAVQRTHAA